MARWVPSHRPAPDPPELSQLDWHGNRAADGLAGEALRRCGPEPPLRDLWESRVRLARGVARVAAAVLEASLEDLHRLATPDVRPLVRRRAGRAVGPRMRIPAPPRRRALPPGIPTGPPPPGVHAVVRRTLPRDRVECTACGASCVNPSRFHTFAYSRCPGPLGTPRVRKAPVWAYSVHSVIRRPDGDPLCVRCGRRTRTTAAARFARARCVARVLDGGPEDVDWGAVLLFLAGRSGWGMPPGRAGGGEADVDGPGGPPSPPRPAAPPTGRAEGVAGVGGVGGESASRPRRRRRSLGLPADPPTRPPPPRPKRGRGTEGTCPPPHPTTLEAHTPGLGGGAAGRPPQPQVGVLPPDAAGAGGGGGEPSSPPPGRPGPPPRALSPSPHGPGPSAGGGAPSRKGTRRPQASSTPYPHPRVAGRVYCGPGLCLVCLSCWVFLPPPECPGPRPMAPPETVEFLRVRPDFGLDSAEIQQLRVRHRPREPD